jgi:hypothetical protein
VNGGLNDKSANTEATCKQACIDDANCFGFDLDTKNTPYTCWFHYTATNLNSPVTDTGINVYKLTRCQS